VLKPFSNKEKGQASIVHVVYVLLAVALVIAIIAGFNQFSTAYNTPIAIDFLTDQGYVVLAAGEYELLAKEATAYAAVVNAEAAVVAAESTAARVLGDLHAEQYVYPELAAPVTLPAEGNPFTYGALTQVVPINTITEDFIVHGVSISGMSANANYVIRITYGAGDTEWGICALTRGGAQTASTVIAIQGAAIPANSIVKMQLADSVGTSTLDVKLIYHLAAE